MENLFSFFTDYQLKKASGNCQEAAKSFSYIVLYFEHPEIVKEIKILVNSLKMADKNEKISEEAEEAFYVSMFQHIASRAGQKIVMLLTSDSDSDFTYIRIMKKFSRNFNLSFHAVRKQLIKFWGLEFNKMFVPATSTRENSFRHRGIPN